MVVVGDNMVVNGLPASLWEIDVKGTRADVLSFYRARLLRRSDVPVLSRQEHDIMSGWLDGAYVTVVVTDGPKPGSVSARLLKTQIANASVRTPPSNLPPGSTVHSQVDSSDGGRISSLLVYSNQQSADANVDHVIAALKKSMTMSVTEVVPGRALHDSRTVYLTNGRGSDAVFTVASKGDRRVMTLNTLSSVTGQEQGRPQFKPVVSVQP